MKAKSLFSKWFFWPLLVGVVIRLFLSSITFHPDIRAIDLGAYLISQKGQILGFYDYLAKLDPDNPLVKIYGVDIFIYPPLAYLVPAFFMLLLSPFYNFSFNNLFLLAKIPFSGNFELFKTLFLLKIHYLLFDVFLAFLFLKCFEGKKGRKAFLLWLFNPATLYATFAMGQLDIFPTLAVVLATLLAFKNRPVLSMVALGIGGGFKLFPLLFIPIFSLVLGEKLIERLKLLGLGLLSYGIIILPYFLHSPIYRVTAVMANQASKMLYMTLPVTAAEGIPVFLLGYFLLLFVANKKCGQKSYLWRLGLALTLLFISVTHYHPQWFLWATPFLIWLMVEFGDKYVYPILFILVGFIVHLLFFDPSLHLGLLAPIFPTLSQLKPLEGILFFDQFMLRNIFRALTAATSIYLLVELILLDSRHSDSGKAKNCRKEIL